ncbi:MAG TPA: organomercurial lyase [Polyangiaceae bacterium]|nr:organomercurial lyase [Polyangiaceae bacterium]
MSDIGTEVANKFKENPAIAAMAMVQTSVLRILVDGRPARVEEIAGAMGRSVDEVQGLVSMLLPMIELDSHGSVIGLGLSFIPTPHRIYFEGRDHVLYTWCVPDALIFPKMLGLSARVVSSCHATKQPIRFNVGPNGVEDVQPLRAVVSWWPGGISQDIRGTVCRNQVLFASPEIAAPWVEEHPSSVVLPVTEAFDATMRIGEQLAFVPRHPAGTECQ